MNFDFKRFLGSTYRFAVAIFVFYLIFDFIFSPVWLHGYVWSLNQNYTRSDYAEEAEGQLLEYQMRLFPIWLRIASFALAVICELIALRYAKGCGRVHLVIDRDQGQVPYISKNLYDNEVGISQRPFTFDFASHRDLNAKFENIFSRRRLIELKLVQA